MLVLKQWPIYLVRAKTQYALTATFLRFQEFYESSYFRGKTFTLEEYMDWYAKRYKGNFTFFNDWSGFNIPSRMLTPFYRGRFDPLSEKEKRLLKMFERVSGAFYVVGVSDDLERSNSALRHEFAHGLFYCVAPYRRAVTRALQNHSLRALYRALARHGYARSVFIDEANAYLLTGLGDLSLKPSDRRKLRLIARELKKIFRDHFGYSMHDASREVIEGQIHTRKI